MQNNKDNNNDKQNNASDSRRVNTPPKATPTREVKEDISNISFSTQNNNANSPVERQFLKPRAAVSWSVSMNEIEDPVDDNHDATSPDADARIRSVSSPGLSSTLPRFMVDSNTGSPLFLAPTEVFWQDVPGSISPANYGISPHARVLLTFQELQASLAPAMYRSMIRKLVLELTDKISTMNLDFSNLDPKFDLLRAIYEHYCVGPRFQEAITRERFMLAFFVMCVGIAQ